MICKRFNDIFKKGELFRIKRTGEVLKYESSEGGANFTSYVTVSILNGFKLVELPLMRLEDVEKVDTPESED